MVFQVRPDHVNGELVHAFFDEQDQFTGLELIEVSDKLPRTPYNDRFWGLRYDNEFVCRPNGKLFTFKSLAEGIGAVEREYSQWANRRRRRAG